MSGWRFPKRPGFWLRAAEALAAPAVDLHRVLHDRGVLPAGVAPVPVISVGNLAAGGTGKTPAVIWLASRLAEAGERPAILTRGYGRRGAGTRVLAAGRAAVPFEEAGDEALEMAAALPGLPVVVGRDRRRTAALAASTLGASCVILDDGFQHRPLGRDFDLVLLDAASPFGNGHRLPAGPLREPPAALARATAILLTRAARAGDLAALRERVAALAPGAWIGAADHIPVGLEPLPGAERGAGEGSGGATPAGPAGKRPAPGAGGAVALAIGTADPASVEESAAALGLRAGPVLTWKDHHRFEERDLARVEEARRGRPVITTGKDAPRWRAVPGFERVREWWVLRIAFRPREEADLLGRIRAAIGKR